MDDQEFQIYDVTAWRRVDDETLGTKEKFWVQDAKGQRWLFKFSRRFSKRTGATNIVGDDWAEKIASRIAALLNLPHATVELASYCGAPGVISLDFTERTTRGELVLGNRLLLEQDPSYPSGESFRVAQHTIQKVYAVLSDPAITLPQNLSTALEVSSPPALFAGYLLLDAIISNQDRHHENWGVLRCGAGNSGSMRAVLAPTFDHASSLGGNLTDEERGERLDTHDAGRTVSAFVRRARSALYEQGGTRPLTTVDAFLSMARLAGAEDYWARALKRVDDDCVWREAIAPVPGARMSERARQFAQAMVRCNVVAIRSALQ